MMNLKMSDDLKSGLSGEWYDKLINGESGEVIYSSDVKSNQIVVNAGLILAGLVRGTQNFGGAIYHAVGRGDPSWDTEMIDPPSDQEQLVDEVMRKQPESISFIDDSGNATLEPTALLRVKTVFNQDELNNVEIREQGLFGGDVQEAGQTGGGLMLNSIRHNSIQKDSSKRWIRYIKLDFSGVNEL